MERSTRTTAVKNGYSKAANGKPPAASEEKVSYMSAYPGLMVSPLLLLCPIFGVLFVYIIVELDGGLQQLLNQSGALHKIIADHILGSKTSWAIIGSFAAFQLVLMRVLPGKIVDGPLTPKGNTPKYKANGMLAFIVTLLVFCSLAFTGLINPAIVYDNFIDIIGGLTLFSIVFVLILYIKGSIAPSSTDNSVSGNFMFDYFWGTELYPRILGWDVKMFTNCRFGLMGWAVLILCYAFKQYSVYGFVSDSMIVSVGIQLVYIAKFFQWEMGYMKSLDIMHDRAGFYICWGCLVWVPSVYTSQSLYLVKHPNELGLPLASLILIAGILSVLINYQADYQRELTRNTNGNCLIWGQRPKLIQATYQTKTGETKKSLLLLSGWWGVARHFHYLPELGTAFLWSVPALFDNPLPYFYFVFLTILLVHRSMRDDERCKEKYGDYWSAYCKEVPYKIIPYVF
ncbi:PREDICTED: 7-dehydrocholesterol reductase-like [Amphimedon queenslandica]|nr:PREDICTED: 7-dehydrocholesterol reductase-like [Amphimedon queenslandica]|eukprot:XP_003385786.1 PREDICTED: 7-dehydrocholesterol reductase-like [Amphimedon queenslandica]